MVLRECQLHQIYRSEDVVLTGYVIPWCVEDGAWMASGNSAAVAAVAAVVRAVVQRNVCTEMTKDHRNSLL